MIDCFPEWIYVDEDNNPPAYTDLYLCIEENGFKFYETGELYGDEWHTENYITMCALNENRARVIAYHILPEKL